MANRSPNFYARRIGHDLLGNPIQGVPEIVVLHLTEGSFDSAYNWLTNPESQASATLLMDRHGFYLPLVDEGDAPWTNGFRQNQKTAPTNSYVRDRCWNNFSPNLITLSIEVEWFREWGTIPVDSPLYVTLVQVVSRWIRRYRLLSPSRIMGHHEIDPDGKPFCGPHIPWSQILRDLEPAFTDITLGSEHKPSTWAARFWEWARQRGICDGDYPRQPATREQVATMIYRATIHHARVKHAEDE